MGLLLDRYILYRHDANHQRYLYDLVVLYRRSSPLYALFTHLQALAPLYALGASMRLWWRVDWYITTSAWKRRCSYDATRRRSVC